MRSRTCSRSGTAINARPCSGGSTNSLRRRSTRLRIRSVSSSRSRRSCKLRRPGWVRRPSTDHAVTGARASPPQTRSLRHQSVMAAARPGDPPITCTLEPGARPDRRADWRSVLSAACERSTTDEGRLRIGFGPDVDLAALTRLIQAEHQCCSFFAFALTVDERGIALEVGARRAAEIVDSMFGRAT